MVLLEAVAGFILAIAVVIGVFWLTFRRPPPRRHSASSTAIKGTSDVDYLIQHWHDDGQGGFGP